MIHFHSLLGSWLNFHLYSCIGFLFRVLIIYIYIVCTGRIWAGHNILRFDCARVREAFAEIQRPPPEPRATIDSLAILTQKFGRRAGDMKVYTGTSKILARAF